MCLQSPNQFYRCDPSNDYSSHFSEANKAWRDLRFWLLSSTDHSREYSVEASLRNFPKQCTKQIKQWVVTLLRATFWTRYTYCSFIFREFA